MLDKFNIIVRSIGELRKSMSVCDDNAKVLFIDDEFSPCDIVDFDVSSSALSISVKSKYAKSRPEKSMGDITVSWLIGATESLKDADQIQISYKVFGNNCDVSEIMAGSNHLHIYVKESR